MPVSAFGFRIFVVVRGVLNALLLRSWLAPPPNGEMHILPFPNTPVKREPTKMVAPDSNLGPGPTDPDVSPSGSGGRRYGPGGRPLGPNGKPLGPGVRPQHPPTGEMHILPFPNTPAKREPMKIVTSDSNPGVRPLPPSDNPGVRPLYPNSNSGVGPAFPHSGAGNVRSFPNTPVKKEPLPVANPDTYTGGRPPYPNSNSGVGPAFPHSGAGRTRSLPNTPAKREPLSIANRGTYPGSGPSNPNPGVRPLHPGVRPLPNSNQGVGPAFPHSGDVRIQPYPFPQ